MFILEVSGEVTLSSVVLITFLTFKCRRERGVDVFNVCLQVPVHGELLPTLLTFVPH